MNKLKKLIVKIKCYTIHNGFKKAEYLASTNIFKAFGENCFWHPRILPSEPERVEIHNNVAIATDVYFCTHDINHIVLNKCPGYVEKYRRPFVWRTGDIVLNDNVFIGAHSQIKYGVKIGPNAIVAMGSVVTKDVPPNTVVGGNPAKVICSFDDYVKKVAATKLEQ